jgi:hypothetical protein
LAGQVDPVRLLVVDASGIVDEVWSNTEVDDCPIIALCEDGSACRLTESPLRQYRELATNIDWSLRGLVYTRSGR